MAWEAGKKIAPVAKVVYSNISVTLSMKQDIIDAIQSSIDLRLQENVDSQMLGFELRPAILRAADLTSDSKPCVAVDISIPYNQDQSPYFCFLVTGVMNGVMNALSRAMIDASVAQPKVTFSVPPRPLVKSKI